MSTLDDCQYHVDAGGALGTTSVYNSCYSSFPNWVNADTLMGLPPLYPNFQCIWIKKQEIKAGYCIGRGTFSIVHKGTYRNRDVVVKSYRVSTGKP